MHKRFTSHGSCKNLPVPVSFSNALVKILYFGTGTWLKKSNTVTGALLVVHLATLTISKSTSTVNLYRYRGKKAPYESERWCSKINIILFSWRLAWALWLHSSTPCGGISWHRYGTRYFACLESIKFPFVICIISFFGQSFNLKIARGRPEHLNKSRLYLCCDLNFKTV
jgi:hypothetical protein